MTNFQTFVSHNLIWVGLFVVVLAALIFNELRGRAGGLKPLDPQQATHLINRENALILDIRDVGSFQQGHIANAHNIPKGDTSKKAKKLNRYKDKPVLLVDRTGQQVSKVANDLKKQGFSQLAYLKGGISAWQGASFPLVKGK